MAVGKRNSRTAYITRWRICSCFISRAFSKRTSDAGNAGIVYTIADLDHHILLDVTCRQIGQQYALNCLRTCQILATGYSLVSSGRI